MSIPLFCPDCRTLVGVVDGAAAFFEIAGPIDSANMRMIACPGKDKHAVPERTRVRHYGLYERVTVMYPETNTSSSWNEYIGRRRPFLAWLALVLSDENSMLIDGKQFYWSWNRSFYGEGAAALKKA